MLKTKPDFDKIKEKVYDIDELEGSDIKINPDYYIHDAILKAQSCLIKDDFKTGMLQYRVLVEHIEGMCRAANRTPTDYDTKLNEYRESQEYKDKEESIKQVLLANKKLEILLNSIFSMKTITNPLSDSK